MRWYKPLAISLALVATLVLGVSMAPTGHVEAAAAGLNLPRVCSFYALGGGGNLEGPHEGVAFVNFALNCGLRDATATTTVENMAGQVLLKVSHPGLYLSVRQRSPTYWLTYRVSPGHNLTAFFYLTIYEGGVRLDRLLMATYRLS